MTLDSRIPLRVLLLAGVATCNANATTDAPCAVIDVDRVGPARVAAIRGAAGDAWWLELGPQLVLCGGEESLGEVQLTRGLRWLDTTLQPEDLRLVRGFTVAELVEAGGRVVARGGQWALVDAREAAGLQVMSDLEPWRRSVLPARQGVVVRQVANDPVLGARAPEGWIQAAVDRVDTGLWLADVEALAGWSRSTHGTEILAARDWLVTRFGSLPGLLVETPAFSVGATTAYNVVATLAGTERPDEWIIVGGHYDAVSGSPGADDNASGCAGVLELARLLTTDPPGVTLLFVCYAGEEQGLYGSEDHADHLLTTGDDDKVVAMVNMDMIAYTGDAVYECDLESGSEHQEILSTLAVAAATYTTLEPTVSTSTCCSDHVSYLQRGMGAVLTIESWGDFNPYYHQPSDVVANLTPSFAGEILRMNLAAVLQLANGDGAIFRDGFEWGDLAAWDPSP